MVELQDSFKLWSAATSDRLNVLGSNLYLFMLYILLLLFYTSQQSCSIQTLIKMNKLPWSPITFCKGPRCVYLLTLMTLCSTRCQVSPLSGKSGSLGVERQPSVNNGNCFRPIFDFNAAAKPDAIDYLGTYFTLKINLLISKLDICWNFFFKVLPITCTNWCWKH